MSTGLSDRVRDLAEKKYVYPALRAGETRFSIRVRDLLTELKAEAEGFPGSHIPQICSALQTSKFLRENGLEIEAVEGPPSRQSTTVVVRYRVAKMDAQEGRAQGSVRESAVEDPTMRATRLTEKLRGLLKEELKEFGGGEAFLRWVRSEDEDAA